MSKTGGKPAADDEAVPPGAAQESGPLRGGKPVEPTPTEDSRHPTTKAEKRSETIREGGEAESRDDG
ncbi:hypothetical protein [Aureimonas leprariae]|uniref:Uncharacterized protein n=1 Tax=Plantimonas leprariae TaxID=2615207 RepID=A0A7V7PNP1_9HYPH|nr:hypothetical protein [Aureimonas leprariae]KAB0679330.1 hypothetical protein F6X38_13420 [Aureimonas leprariae]